MLFVELEFKNEKEEKEFDFDKLKKVIVMVEYDGWFGCLMFNCWFLCEGVLWLKYDDDGSEFEVEFGDVWLFFVIEG